MTLPASPFETIGGAVIAAPPTSMLLSDALPGRPATRSEPLLALINVAFLLLVFMLLLGPAQPLAPGVTPPSADAAQTREAGPVPTLSLDRHGQAYVGAEPMARERLTEWVSAQTVSSPQPSNPAHQPVVLVADAALPAGDLARVLTELADAGITRVHLQTRARGQALVDDAGSR